MKTRVLLAHQTEIPGLLDGRQTVIIRPVTANVPVDADEVFFWHSHLTNNCAKSGLWARNNTPIKGWLRYIAPCPFGVPGDNLCVKETWAIVQGELLYRATEPFPDLPPQYRNEDGKDYEGTWRSSSAMPARYSRLSLEVVSAQVKQLRDLTEEDAQAAGYEAENRDNNGNCWHKSAIEFMQDSWNMTYAKRGYPWLSSTWAWVVEVRRVEK